MKHSLRLIALLLAVLLAMPCVAFAGSAKYVVTCDALCLRKSASTQSDVLAKIPQGTVVTVSGSSGNFYKVQYSGYKGFAAKEYLKKQTASSGAAKSSGASVKSIEASAGVLKEDTVLYASASKNATKLLYLSKGASVSVTGYVGSWYRVSVSGTTGFVGKSVVGKGGSSSNGSSSYTALQLGSSGDAVTKLQKRLRALGYNVSVTGSYGSETVNAVKHFQMQTGGTINGAASAAMQKKLYASTAPACKKVVTMDWFTSGINGVFARGATAYIIDCATGTRIQIRRVQGTNHADVEPATASDTAKLKSVYGGAWSWNSRAVVLVVGGYYVAAAINGMPHGAQTSTTNNFNGHFCLHTTNSRTHGTDKVNASHQAKIKVAASYLK